jgi:hypothetical protein
VRLGDDSIAHLPIEEEPHGRSQQRPSVPVAETAHRKRRNILKVLTGLARGKNEYDWLGQQSSPHESEHLGGRPVQPLGVIDDAEQRPFIGGIGQEAEDG